MKFFRRVWLLFLLSRPVNLLLLAATGFLALYILHREQGLMLVVWWQGACLIGSALLIMAGGYWLNDLYDVEIDTFNRPGRAARVRLLTRRRLMTAVIGGWVLGLLCTLPLPWTFRGLHLLAVAALFWYNRWGKRRGLIGNLLVAALTALLPWEVLLLAGRTAYAVDWMIPFALIFNFVREVVKDAEDMPGDRLYGVRSLPGQLSPALWSLFLRAAWVSLLLLLFLPAFLKYLLWGVWPGGYLLVVGVGSALPLLLAVRRFSDYGLLSRHLKLAMAGGLVALVFF